MLLVRRMKRRCLHWSPRGYGRCVLKPDHPSVENENGVLYSHQYLPSGAHSRFDPDEKEGPTLDPCSVCGGNDAVTWFLVRSRSKGTYAWRWRCTLCGAQRYLEVPA